MVLVKAADAPVFEVHGGVITGGAAPSRGASQTCMWRIDLAGGTTVPAHILDHHAVFHALSGVLLATVNDAVQHVEAGDTLIVQAGASLKIDVPADGRFQAVVALPAGTKARFAAGGEPFSPPWAV